MARIKQCLRSEWGQMAILVLLLLAGRSSLADHYFVPSGSMEFTLMPGDRVVVDKTAYGIRIPFTKIALIDMDIPQPGEIAVFDSPANDKLLIKRIVAVGGDRVDLVNGRLWINGQRLAKSETATVEEFDHRMVRLNLDSGSGPDIRELVIPDGKVLVLGDHRGNSSDGRYFGLISERDLYGRAISVYYSRNNGFQWKRL